jgi:hypothetical protein
VETPRKFITAKLSIRKPGSSSDILLALMKIRAYGLKALQQYIFTWFFHKQNYYMFYRHANVQRTYN